MNVTKTQTENTENTKTAMYCGLEQWEIVAINPTAEEINALYGKETNESNNREQVYIDESKDGFDRVRITFFLRGLQTNRIRRASFYIEDKPRVDKDGIKTQYVNQVGQSTWTDVEKNLPQFFTKFEKTNKDKSKTVIGDKTYRIARSGDGDFYEFARGVMSKIIYSDITTDIMIDFKKMLKGNFEELRKYLMAVEYSEPFTALNYIKVEEGGEARTFNEIYTKAILPGYFYPRVHALMASFYKETAEQLRVPSGKEEFERLRIPGIQELLVPESVYGYITPPEIKFRDEFDNARWTKFKKVVENKDFGPKGFYKIAPVFEYHTTMDGSGTQILAHDTSY